MFTAYMNMKTNTHVLYIILLSRIWKEKSAA